MRQKILVTGFEPFGGESTNPSMEIARALEGTGNANCIIHSAILPVERFRAVQKLIEIVEEDQPDTIVALGVAAGRGAITPEKVAINFDDFRIADNGDNQPIGEPIVPDGPAAHFSTLPINVICNQLTANGAPSSVSFSAGTFVCNHLMYGILDHIERQKLPIRAGFIHVPQASEFCTNTNVPSMPLSTMIDALKIAIMEAACLEQDIKQVGGNTH